MNFYTSLFDDSEVTNLTRYGAEEKGTEETVKQAKFTLHGETYKVLRVTSSMNGRSRPPSHCT